MRKPLKFTLQIAENGVYYSDEKGRTFVFTGPLDLGAFLFDLVEQQPEGSASYNVYLTTPPRDRQIAAIKAVRMIGSKFGDDSYDVLGLREAKELVDKAFDSGEVLIMSDVDAKGLARIESLLAEVGLTKAYLKLEPGD